ncbi:MAG: glycosyltransferase, partial [Verrucomicrobiota bacterium]
MSAELAIVVPLFNESDNVQPLVDELVRVFAAEKRPWEIVLVDDSST